MMLAMLLGSRRFQSFKKDQEGSERFKQVPEGIRLNQV